MTDVDLGDVVIHVESWGGGDGAGGRGHPPLVLVHGYVGSSADWTDVAPALAADGRWVLAVDHRGHGASSNTGDAAHYKHKHLAGDLVRTLDALGVETFDLLGHSLGGVVSMHVVIAHPERVRSVVFMATAATPASDTPPDVLASLADAALEQGIEPVWQRIAPFVEAVQPSDERRARARSNFMALDPVGFHALGASLFDYPSLIGELRAVRCPATVMVGEHDTDLHRSAEDLAWAIPGARLVLIPDAGHSPQDDQPERWLGAVRDHLLRVTQA